MIKKIFVLVLVAFTISACGEGLDIKPVDNRTKAELQRDEHGSFFGFGNSLGGKDKELEGNFIAVNAYLWRASLDTLSINPIEKINPNAGIIQTEWVSISDSGDEQTKISAVIISADLRTTGVRVNVYKRKKVNGVWINSAVSPETVNAVEKAILQRARELRSTDAN